MKTAFNLIICAHPDDETIYFGGLILQERSIPWKVICVTDGNADLQKDKRAIQFRSALKKLGVDSYEGWGFPDVYENRLNVDDISKHLGKLEIPEKVFTHGIIGEYGHPHHQDVSYAVHKFFKDKCDVYSVAYNCFPDILINLSAKEYELKTKILSTIYATEINHFAHLVPGTSSEGFTKVELDEVENIYQNMVDGKKLTNKLKKYKWLENHIKEVLNSKRKRLF